MRGVVGMPAAPFALGPSKDQPSVDGPGTRGAYCSFFAFSNASSIVPTM